MSNVKLTPEEIIFYKELAEDLRKARKIEYQMYRTLGDVYFKIMKYMYPDYKNPQELKHLREHKSKKSGTLTNKISDRPENKEALDNVATTK